MQSRWIKGVVVVLAGAAVLVASACVGDDPAVTTGTAKPDGERGGKCFPNNTCNGAALSCIDGVCILPGDLVDGGVAGSEGGIDGSTQTDAAAGDGGADATIDSACPPPPTTAGEVACNGAVAKCTPSPGSGCCTSTGTCANACAGASKFHLECDGPGDCPGANPICCLTRANGAFALPPGQCPAKLVDFYSTACVQAKASCAGGLSFCSDTDPCAGGSTCRSMDVDVGDPTVPKTLRFGVCVLDKSP